MGTAGTVERYLGRPVEICGRRLVRAEGGVVDVRADDAVVVGDDGEVADDAVVEGDDPSAVVAPGEEDGVV